MAAVRRSFWAGRAEPVYRFSRPGVAPVQTGACSSGSEVLGIALGWKPTTDPTMLYDRAQAALDADINPLCARSRQQALVALRQLDQRARTMPPGQGYVLEYAKRVVMELMKAPSARRPLSMALNIVRAPMEQPSRGRQITDMRRGDLPGELPPIRRRAPWLP